MNSVPGRKEGSDSKVSVPPARSTISLETHKPSPVPPIVRVV